MTFRKFLIGIKSALIHVMVWGRKDGKPTLNNLGSNLMTHMCVIKVDFLV